MDHGTIKLNSDSLRHFDGKIKKYRDLDTEEKIAKAITAHNEGYNVESFTILFEVIKYELCYLIDFSSPGFFGQDLHDLSYRELTLLAEKDKILSYRGILDLHLFRSYRNRVIHTIVNEKIIDHELLDMWFDFGRKLNQRISRKTVDVFHRDIYDPTEDDPLNFY